MKEAPPVVPPTHIETTCLSNSFIIESSELPAPLEGTSRFNDSRTSGWVRQLVWVESKARVEVYPLHIPNEQRSPQQYQKFYPVDNIYEQSDQLQQQFPNIESSRDFVSSYIIADRVGSDRVLMISNLWQEKSQKQQQPIRHLPEQAFYAQSTTPQQTYSRPKPEYERHHQQSIYQPHQTYQQQFYGQLQSEQQYRDKNYSVDFKFMPSN
ncbi:hypothetical protein X798_05949 [Onchocerca flexuosa]|uniref:Uncharacterized protein n=1 Tax=Onchocerca flexuosa TaxID=387005 RepID=A0A238BNV0_9BILA|nr:hypothetical protein X798_05949 [Onchocerca flexuosa]